MLTFNIRKPRRATARSFSRDTAPAPANTNDSDTTSNFCHPTRMVDRAVKPLALVPATLTAPANVTPLVSHGSHVIEPDRELLPGLARGDIPVALPSRAKLQFSWLGPKIATGPFRTILSFLNWTQQKFGGESQAKIFYHPLRREWGFEVLPQNEPKGLHTHELETHPDREGLFKTWMSSGWVLNGTIHHHCNISAFQSGTDSADELRFPGLHITVGKLGSKIGVADWHARYTLNGIMYTDLPASMFLDSPETDLNLADLPTYPGEWETRLIKPTPAPAASFAAYSSSGFGFGYGQGYDFADDTCDMNHYLVLFGLLEDFPSPESQRAIMLWKNPTGLLKEYFTEEAEADVEELETWMKGSDIFRLTSQTDSYWNGVPDTSDILLGPEIKLLKPEYRQEVERILRTESKRVVAWVYTTIGAWNYEIYSPVE